QDGISELTRKICIQATLGGVFDGQIRCCLQGSMVERKSNAQYVKDWVDLRTTNETLFECLIVRLSCLRNVGLGLCQVFWGAGQREVYAAVKYSNSCVTSEVLSDHLAWHAPARQHVAAGGVRALGNSSRSTHQNSQGARLAR